MNFDSELYRISGCRLCNFLNEYEKNLSKDTLESVRHFIENGEYEIAFEGLFTDIMAENKNISNKTMVECLEIGKDLGLDKESVFDANFWQKLLTYSRV